MATISNNLRNVQADATKVRFDNGYLELYDGAKPASPQDSVGASVLLARLRFTSPAAASQANGLITMNPLVPESSAPAGGHAVWYRALEADGTTPLADGTCGVGAGYDCQMATTTIVLGQVVSCSAFTHLVKEA